MDSNPSVGADAVGEARTSLRPVIWRSLLAIGLAYGAWDYWHARPISHPPGILAPADPVQTALDKVPVLRKSGYNITPVQSFSLKAVVLAAERYRFDRGAELVPVDLALGWGPMSDQSIVDRVDISQSGRFYFWHVSQFPIPRREIETHSANMHMIPADKQIEKRLKAVRVGQVISLEGYLVNVQGADGFQWHSSLTREDTGNGACELVWVEKLEVR